MTLRRLAGVGLVVLAALVGLAAFSGGAAAAAPSCGGTNGDFAGGDGSSATPYQIANVSHLQCMNHTAHLGANFTLTADIDASNTSSWNGGLGFSPVGNLSTPFNGSLDGQGNTISNLTIDRSAEDRVGLFGVVDGGQVANVHLENVSVTGVGVGGLVGRNEGDVTNTSASGTVSGDSDVGGLVGSNDGNVTDSYATGTVNGTTDIGGLVGFNAGTGSVTDSYATGTVTGNSDVGGLVGDQSGVSSSVTDSYATGTVIGGSSVGGLIGGAGGVVTDSYWDVNTTNQTTSAGGTGLTTRQLTGDRATANLAGFDFTATWTTVADSPGVAGYGVSYLVLQNNTQSPAPSSTLYAGGDGSESNPYVIEDWHHLDSVRVNLDANYTLATDLGPATAGYDIAASATANAGAGFAPVGDPVTPFNGSFDGQGNTISNLTVNRSTEDDVGLFGVMTSSDSVADVVLENVSVAGESSVGGLVGNSSGTVTSVSVTGNVTGDDNVGGLVGLNNGSVTDSSSSGDVNGSSNRVGGLVGSNDGNVANSSATGTVTGSGTDVGGLVGSNNVGGSVTNSSAGGTVDGSGDRVGGLVGNTAGPVANSSASGTVTGDGDVGGLVGLVDPQGGSVTNSSATGNVTGSGDGIGGLVGDSSGPVTMSYAMGNVTSTGVGQGTGQVGGLVGFNVDSVTKSFATGAVTSTSTDVGGLVGRNAGSVATSYATGNVSGDSAVGGLVGSMGGQGPSVTTSYATGNVSGGTPVGGLIGDGFVGTVTDSYWDLNTTNQTTSGGGAGATGHPTANLTGAAAPTNMTGFDFASNWTSTDEYPHLRWEVEALALDLGSTSLDPGDTTQATVTLSLVQGSTVTATTVATYGSDDASVATMADNVVTAQGSGDTDVTADHAGHAAAVALSVQSAGGGGGSDDDNDGQTAGCGPSASLENADFGFGFGGDVACVELVFVDGDAPGTVTVDVPGALPADAAPIPGTTGLVFVDVTVPSSLSDSAATMQFTLETDPLGDVDPADLVVYRYDGGEWTALETTVVSTTSDEVVLEATTPGFSLFAVGSAAQQDTPDETTPEDEPAPTPGGTPTPGEDTTPDPGTPTPGTDGLDDEPDSLSGVPLVALLVAAIVAVALAVAAVRRRA